MEHLQEQSGYGAAELKRSYNRHLAIAFGISVAFHAFVIGYFLLGEPDTSREHVRLAELPRPKVDTTFLAIRLADNPGKQGAEGGGAPDSDKPLGRAQRGHPNAVPDHSHDRPDPKRNVDIKNPDRIKPVAKPTTPPALAGDRRDTSKSSVATGTRGQNVEGTGDRPAGGGGGLSVGVGGASGMGSRGWEVRPRATYPGSSNVTGTVVLRFTVMPNGAVTNITPVKRADPALVAAAIAGLRRAKARPLPDDVPQVAQQAQIPFTFQLR